MKDFKGKTFSISSKSLQELIDYGININLQENLKKSRYSKLEGWVNDVIKGTLSNKNWRTLLNNSSGGLFSASRGIKALKFTANFKDTIANFLKKYKNGYDGTLIESIEKLNSFGGYRSVKSYELLCYANPNLYMMCSANIVCALIDFDKSFADFCHNSSGENTIKCEYYLDFCKDMKELQDLINEQANIIDNFMYMNELIVGFYKEKINSNEGENMKKEKSISIPKNYIIYGIPGSGKSYYIDKILLKGIDENQKMRVTFYPEYNYTDFVGTYKMNKEGNIVPSPGPFTRILKLANEDKKNNYYLIIEEMSRGNAEAIFGDIFQILDRNAEYEITNDFISECIGKDKIKLPKNLYIIATINTSDQNVFNLDSAFGRRWDYMRYNDDISEKNYRESSSEDLSYLSKKIFGSKITWKDFRIAVNNAIVNDPEIWNSEDKQMGLFYISKECFGDKEAFINKIIRYLWFDVFTNHETLINLLNQQFKTSIDSNIKSFDELYKELLGKKNE